MIERKDTHEAGAGTDKSNSTSLASEVYQWGSHQVDNAKGWAKEHPKTAMAAEATALAAGAGLVFMATKGHGGQKLAAEALEDAGVAGAKVVANTGRETGAILAKDSLSIVGDTATAATKGFGQTLEHSAVGQPGSAGALLRSVEADAASTSKVLPAALHSTEADAATLAKGAANFDATAGKVVANTDATAGTVAANTDATALNVGAKAADTAVQTGVKAETAAADSGSWLSGLPKWARIGVPVLTAGGLATALAGCDQDPDEKPEEARVYKDVNECTKDGVYTEKFCEDEFKKAEQTHFQIAPKFTTKEECEEETGDKCEAAPAAALTTTSSGDAGAQALVTNPSAGGDSTVSNPVTAPAPTLDANGQPVATDANGQPLAASQQKQCDANQQQPCDTTVGQPAQPGTNTVVIHEHSGGGFFMPYMYGYMMGQNSANNAYISRPLYSSSSGSGYVTPEGREIGTSTGRVSVPAASMSRATVGVSEGAHMGSSGSVSRGAFGGSARGGVAGFGG